MNFRYTYIFTKRVKSPIDYMAFMPWYNKAPYYVLQHTYYTIARDEETQISKLRFLSLLLSHVRDAVKQALSANTYNIEL